MMASPYPLLAGVLGCGLLLGNALAAEPQEIERGRYVFYAGACDSCHTDHEEHGAFLAGGTGLETPFGTFYVPNITPDEETGLGDWTYEEFKEAMVAGVSPAGEHYYPVFPYRWYTGMSDEDLRALWEYLQNVPAVRKEARAHDLPFPFNIRELLLGWKLINFDQGHRVQDEQKSAAWNRGAYIVNHLGHCGACHTPKLMGMIFLSYDALAGSESIPGPYFAPNITQARVDGLGTWSNEDIVRAMQRAMTPLGEPIRGPMAEYVNSGSRHLSDEDLMAIATYLKDFPPHEGPVEEREERRDRRLVDSQSEGATGSGGGGMGSAGMGLLTVGVGGRTRAK